MTAEQQREALARRIHAVDFGSGEVDREWADLVAPEDYLAYAGAILAAGYVSPEVHAAAIREAAEAQAVIDATLAEARELTQQGYPTGVLLRILSAAPRDALDAAIREARAEAFREAAARIERFPATPGQARIHAGIAAALRRWAEQEAASPEPAHCTVRGHGGCERFPNGMVVHHPASPEPPRLCDAHTTVAGDRWHGCELADGHEGRHVYTRRLYGAYPEFGIEPPRLDPFPMVGAKGNRYTMRHPGAFDPRAGYSPDRKDYPDA